MIPRWLKLLYLLYVLLLVPSYLFEYDLLQFLWFSNIAFLVTAVAIWRENALLASMMAVGALIPDLVWNISFWLGLLFEIDPVPVTAYLFDRNIPLHLRLLSLYHVPLPLLLVWLVYRLGYDRRALLWQTLLGWTVLTFCFFFTEPRRNVNWSHGYDQIDLVRISPGLWLFLLLSSIFLVAYLPADRLLNRFFGSSAKGKAPRLNEP